MSTANRRTDSILGDIVPGTTEQDVTENLNRHQTGAAKTYDTLCPQGWRVHYAHAVTEGRLHMTACSLSLSGLVLS